MSNVNEISQMNFKKNVIFRQRTLRGKFLLKKIKFDKIWEN